MKILIITRIYTALADCINTKNWHPNGMPAYYKLLEGMSERDDIYVDAVCLGKIEHNGIIERENFKFQNLKIDFYVAPFKSIKILKIFGRVGRMANGVINDILQLSYALSLNSKSEYDLIYVDRANIIFGALFSSVLKKKVAIRLYGVGSLIKRMRGTRKWLREPFRYLSYKAHFSRIICTKDGSGAGYFIEHFMNRKVPYEILLNGVDKNACKQLCAGQNNFLRDKYNIGDGKRIILFLTRLSKDKGADIFVKSMVKLAYINKDFLAVIVGEGPLENSLKKEVEEQRLGDSIKFSGAVEHSDVYAYYNAADIYVSLNLLGNLCNTVLEAINAGKCIVTFKRDEADYTDDDTESILKGKAALINKKSALQELPKMLDYLLRNEWKIKELSLETKKLSAGLLKSWREHISHEIDLLRKIA